METAQPFPQKQEKIRKPRPQTKKEVHREPTVVYKGLQYSLILKKRNDEYELRRINMADPEALERERVRKELAKEREIKRA